MPPRRQKGRQKRRQKKYGDRGNGGRRELSAKRGPPEAQCSGTSPKTSLIRLRSRIRGWVAPPTQRLTVFTDTPSCRAAASWVMPSRRSALDIHSANEAVCFSAAAWPSAAATAGSGVAGGGAPG